MKKQKNKAVLNKKIDDLDIRTKEQEEEKLFKEVEEFLKEAKNDNKPT